MQLTEKTIAVLAAVFVTLLAGAALVVEVTVRPGFRQLETTIHERNSARVAANLAAIADDMRGRVTDYANWDDTYAFAGGGNRDYVNDLTDDWFSNYGIDLAVFSDASGRTLWARRRTADGALTDDFALGARLTGEASRAHDAAGGEGAPAGTAWVEGLGFVLVTASPILRTDGGGPSRGWVVMGQRITEPGLSEQAQLDIQLFTPATAPPGLEGRLQGLSRDGGQSWTERDAIYSLSPFRGFDGEITGALMTRQKREITALGAHSIAIAMALFAALLTLAVVALGLVLRGVFIRRIVSLERHFNAQQADPAPIIVAETSTDELTRLANAYNALTARLRDTTRSERAAQAESAAAAAANRMKSDFLANISHELRTPLDAIIGYAELADEQLQGEGFDNIRRDLARVNEAARAQLALIGEIFDLSKIEAGRLEIKPETFDARTLIDGALRAVAPLAKGHATQTVLQIEGQLGLIYSDRQRLRQSLINTLSAACKLAHGGRVTLTARRDAGARGDILRIEVRHIGAALSHAQLAHIFEPFAQTRSAQSGGSRLGLAVTRKLLERMGGGIEAASADNATIFTLLVPALYDEDLAEAA